MTPRTKEGKEKARRNENRKALRRIEEQTRNVVLIEGRTEVDIAPEDAMQYTLDVATSMLKHAVEARATLRPDELWRDTMVGRIPNEWIRLEQDLRKEVYQIAGRMLQLDIDGRRANAAEAVAMLIAPVMDHIFKELHLTSKQKKAAPQAVHSGMKLLEGGGS